MDFHKIAFNACQADAELAEFKAWMTHRPYFCESEA
jgi:hypothetical protein